VAGGAGALAATVAAPAAAQAAATQDWPPFVLVAGLLLIGLVADGDGLFRYTGQQLARLGRSGAVLFAGAVVIVVAVTVTLNLDTAVAFVTPVLVYTARSRVGGGAGADGGTGTDDGAAGGEAAGGEAALLYGCLLLANAGSLLLPGSNLTNLIVLGELRLTGGQFVARMWLPWLAAVAVTAVVLAVRERGSVTALTAREMPSSATRPVTGAGLVAVAAATVVVVVLRSPAIPVVVIGLAVTGLRLAQRQLGLRQAREVLGLPVLAGLLGVAVALGTLGRAWSGPELLLSHLDGWATAGLAALATVAVNNLPAASLLAARPPGHPFALLVGLNLGPNLCVTGSLAWLLWLRAARGAGARPSLARASRLGIVAVPLAMALALGALALTGQS
jgi:arsenical pump membrane protein